MINKINYLSFYSLNPIDNSAAADTKVKYITKVLENLGYNVDLISANNGRSLSMVDGKQIWLSDKIKFVSFKALPYGNLFKRFIRRKFNEWQLKKYLKNNLTSKDIIIIYHSLYYYKLYKWIKRKTGAKIILEVEEIYSDVGKTRFVTRKKEVKSFSYANAYILPTELLDKQINISNKPSIIIYGTYKKENKCGQPANDGKIHIVYAGTFDPRKGGAVAAAAAAEFLNGNYHVHILGFGSENDKSQLLATIDKVSNKTDCIVTFDGLKSGDDYIKFIQSCDIGLSTQNPDAAFNGTSFPSKILSYMSNGLRVVSVRIPAIEQSAIGKYMYYYDEQTPEKIADAIISVDMNDDYNGKGILERLNMEFTDNIKQLINGLSNESI